MKHTVSDLDLTKLVISDEQNQPRSDDYIHVSGVLRYIKKVLGEGDSTFTENDLEWFAVVGRLWEHTLSRLLYPEPRYTRIGELERDGIVGNPDNLDLQLNRFGEFKVCYKSSRNFSETLKFKEYTWQLLSYIALGIPVLGTQTQYEAWLDIFHIGGDWRPPVPKAHHYELTFTHGEVQTHWRMMLIQAQHMRETQ